MFVVKIRPPSQVAGHGNECPTGVQEHGIGEKRGILGTREILMSPSAKKGQIDRRKLKSFVLGHQEVVASS